MRTLPFLVRDQEGHLTVNSDAILLFRQFLQLRIVCVLGNPVQDTDQLTLEIDEEPQEAERSLKACGTVQSVFISLGGSGGRASLDSKLSLTALAISTAIIIRGRHCWDNLLHLFKTFKEFQDNCPRSLIACIDESPAQVVQTIKRQWDTVNPTRPIDQSFSITTTTDSSAKVFEKDECTLPSERALCLVEILVQELNAGKPVNLSRLQREALTQWPGDSKIPVQDACQTSEVVQRFVAKYVKSFDSIEGVIEMYEYLDNWRTDFQFFTDTSSDCTFLELECEMAYIKSSALKLLVNLCLADIAYHCYKLKTAEIDSELVGIYVYSNKLDKQVKKLNELIADFPPLVCSRIQYKLQLFNSALSKKLSTTRNVSIAGGAASVALAATGVGLATWIGRAAFVASSMVSVYEGLNVAGQVGAMLASLGYTAFNKTEPDQELQELVVRHQTELEKFIELLAKSRGAKLMCEIDQDLVETQGLTLTKYDLELPLIRAFQTT